VTGLTLCRCPKSGGAASDAAKYCIQAMTDSVGWGSEQDQRPFSAAASGEDGPWARWIPNAWQAVADPDGRHSAPALPMRMGGPGHGRVLNEHAELLAWWGPFTHLLWFGLGSMPRSVS
jgi:hypothetical protein